MKLIDLLNKMANNEEIPKTIRFGESIYVLTEPLRYEDILDEKILEERFIFERLNDEIEIIEEETTYEQNFTGLQIKNGKIMVGYNYNEPTLKPVDIADVEKDIKEMLEEKPKKIEEINKSYPIFNFDEKSFDAMKDMLQDVYSKQVEVINAVNYLLEKESK